MPTSKSLKSLPFELPKETALIKFRRSHIDEIRLTKVHYKGNLYVTARWWIRQEDGKWTTEDGSKLTLKWEEAERLGRAVAKHGKSKPFPR